MAGVDRVVLRPVARVTPVLQVLKGIVRPTDGAQFAAGIVIDRKGIDILVDLDDMSPDRAFGVAVAGHSPREPAPELLILKEAMFQRRFGLEKVSKLLEVQNRSTRCGFLTLIILC